MLIFSDVVFDQNGKGRAGASVAVSQGGFSSTIYEADGTTAKSNPFASAAYGAYSFGARNGVYDVAVSIGGKTSRAQALIFDPATLHFFSLKDYGCVADGRDESAKIQAALNAASAAGGGEVVGGAGTYGVGTQLTIPAKVTLRLVNGSYLKPTANVSVVLLKPNANFQGKIDCSALAGWNKVAIDIDGDANNDAIPYRLNTPTEFDAELVGATSGSNGTAVKVHADGVANARVMGVIGKARVSGFDTALWLRQTSTDHSKFVNGCVFDFDVSSSLRGLLMDSANSLTYDIDGNRIRMQIQPRTGTTVPAFALCGQLNVFDLLPWDWDTVAGTSPYAITLPSGMRKSIVRCSVDPTYISNSATDRNNVIFNAWDDNCIVTPAMKSSSSDAVIRVSASTLRLDNAKAISSRTADGLSEYDMLYTDASNNTFVQSMNVSGALLIYDARSASSGHFWRINGSNKAILTSAGNFELQTVGAGIKVKEGSNAKQGAATLSGGTVTVSNTSVTANSRILLTAQDNSSTGTLRVSARVAGTSFTITSSNAGDSGVVAYQIFEPA